MKKIKNIQVNIIIIFLSLLFCGTIGFLIQKNLTKFKISPIKKISYANVNFHKYPFFSDHHTKLALSSKDLLEIEKNRIYYEKNCMINKLITLNNTLQINYPLDLDSKVISECNKEIKKILKSHSKIKLIELNTEILFSTINKLPIRYNFPDDTLSCQETFVKLYDISKGIKINWSYSIQSNLNIEDFIKFIQKSNENLILLSQKLIKNSYLCIEQYNYILNLVELLNNISFILNLEEYFNYNYLESSHPVEKNNSIKNKNLIILLSLILSFPLSVLLIKFYPHFRK